MVTLLQYFLHDVVHHLWDVTGQQDAAASLPSSSLVTGCVPLARHSSSSARSARQRASRSASSASASSRSRRFSQQRAAPLGDVVDQELQLPALAGGLVVEPEDVGDLGQGETEPLARAG